MARPKLKRKRARPGVYIKSDDFPMDSFLRHCPLPADLSHLEPLLRGPVGQSLLTSIITCYDEGFSRQQIEAVSRQVVEFYATEYHRCTSCFAWTKDFAAGAVVMEGKFMITVICARCGRLVAHGRETEAMDRNVADFIFGGME